MVLEGFYAMIPKNLSQATPLGIQPTAHPSCFPWPGPPDHPGQDHLGGAALEHRPALLARPRPQDPTHQGHTGPAHPAHPAHLISQEVPLFELMETGIRIRILGNTGDR